MFSPLLMPPGSACYARPLHQVSIVCDLTASDMYAVSVLLTRYRSAKNGPRKRYQQ